MPPVQARGDFIDGRFVLPAAPTAEIEKRSPADLDDRVGTFPIAFGHVDLAVEAARKAARGWAATKLEDRVALLQNLKNALISRTSALVEAIGRDVGKPAWEAKTEVQALASKIDITVGEGLALVKQTELEGGRLQTRYKPHGVLGIIGPFNFPLHLAHGHLVPALATGNTVVFKPSEVAPATAQIYAEALESAGFPPGVVNVVHGKGPEGAHLAGHPDVDGILFTGSYPTGVKILEANVARPGRMLALELGGKNTAIVLADAPFEKALYDVLFSALVTAGQRCTAVSRVVIERGLAESFVAEMSARCEMFTVGAPTQDGVFYGPLATQAGFEKFLAAQQTADREGHVKIRPSRGVHGVPRGYYVRPSMHLVTRPSPASRYEHEEIFGPDIAVYVADDLEHACRLADATPFGLAAGVFTASEAKFEACYDRLSVGCVTWNAPTVGSSSRLPFGGTRNSGNHRPAGVFSTLYCTYPVAVTQGTPALDASKLPPGVRWQPV